MSGSKYRPGARPWTRATSGGAALILALACIVILTALVLLFLSHSLMETQVSVASADQTSASLLARGAVDAVIGELKQEITAGSAASFPPAGSDVRDPNTVFFPATNQAMVPYRMDAAAPANVVKRSAYNVPFYAGSYYNTNSSTGWPAPEWAVNFSSTNPGTSGRAVSMTRWNAPLLMPTADSTSTNQAPPLSFTPPDWIYQTRLNGPATSWNANLVPNLASGALNGNCVVGRYAYVVYDEGGLLDANAAGYSTGTGVTAAMMRHKISEACADLTQIGLLSSDIDALIAWRNPVSGASVQAYTNYVYNAATNAFLTPASGDRLFTSRQQLIAFLMQDIAGTDAASIERMQAALPYLTTFSRELNQPSWYPQTNMAAGVSGYGYLTLATNTPASATNAFAPLARATAMYTNASGLICQGNQPAAFDRFPLSRLSWITLNGTPPAGVTAAQIQQSFGLVWDSANYAWNYVGTGATTLNKITPLSQVTGREPNFFELLKAAILSGSVNALPQTALGSFPSPGDIDARYAVIDQQTMQIGLAMIDQASSNALPARVEFGANAGTNPSNSEDMALYGSKNLPYLYKMVVAWYRPTTIPADSFGTTNAYLCAWAEPVFWSPYMSAVTNAAPLQVRIRADSTNAATGYNQFYADTFSTTADVRVCGPALPCGGPGTSTDVGGTSGATIELDTPNAATLQNATLNPVLFSSLLTSGSITDPPPINDLRAANPWTGGPANADIYTESSSTGTASYAGFWMGMALAPNNYSDPHASSPVGLFNTAVFSHGSKSPNPAGRADHAFVLEANYGTALNPKFLEVQRMTFKYTAQYPTQVQEADCFVFPNRRLDFFTFNDPRTGRFSFDFMNPTDYNVHNGTNSVSVAAVNQLTWTTFPNSGNPFSGDINNVPVAGASMGILPALSAAPGAANAPQDTFRFADNSTAVYANQNPAYFDTDGAQRPGDAWWSSATINTMPTRVDAGTLQYRPVILNRPFYSVGELGYVYRDMPWRSLDVGTAQSADAGVLDYFCVNDGYAGATNAPVVAGVLNLNTSHPQVLQAMLNGATRAELTPSWDISAADASSIATAITNITANVPLLNKAELATRVAPADPTIATPSVDTGTADSHIKEEREASVRALASVGQVRTWNLMIDVVAQTGHFPPGATGFSNFLVTAEQRYWAHVAIDRYTGQVVSFQLEPVSQ